MFNVPAFRALMKDLIGDSTQVEFAAEKGITPVHLSRLMRSEKPPRPSKDTLKKIAGNSNGIYEELLSLCGYRGEETQVILETKEDKAKKRMEEMRDGFREMTKSVRVYDSVTDFLEEYMLLYDSKNASFATGRKVEYDEGDHYGAEYVIPLAASYSVDMYECRIYAALYFSETKGGKVIVLDSALDGKSVIRAGVEIADENKEKIKDLPFLYALKRDVSAEERLLKAIFGEAGMETVTTSVIGFGISFKKYFFTNDMLRQFTEAHMDTYGEGSAERKCANRIFLGERAQDVLDDYDNSTDLGGGAGAFVAQTIRAETGIGFTFYEDVTGDLDAVSAVMVERKDYDLYDVADMKEAACRYAKELGLPECGECLVYIHDYIDANMRVMIGKEDE